MDQTRTIRVGCGQFRAYPMNRAAKSLSAIERMIEQAAEAQLELLVLPECAYPAYLIRSEEKYRTSGVWTSRQYVEWLSDQARRHRIHIVSGYVEDAGTHLHNSAILIDDGGQTVGNYRKSFLWDRDNEWFKPGDEVRAFDTRLGRIGMVICADARVPEIIAKLVIDKAQIIAMPTCWINTARDEGGFSNPQVEFLISARAREFGIPFVCANKFGGETPKVGYCGRSMIVEADGRVSAEAPGNQEMLLAGQVTPANPDRVHFHNELWESLLAWDQPIRPNPVREEPVMAGLCPGEDLTAQDADWFEQQNVSLLLANGIAEETTTFGRSMTIALPSSVGAIRNTLIGRIGCLRGAEFVRLGKSRLLALGGAEAICVFDAPDDVKLMRARAVENRVFVLAVSRQIAAAIAPNGDVLAYSDSGDKGGLIVSIRMTDAADKTVAPHTDIWEQRRVEVYR